MRGAQADINLNALKHNLQQVRELVGETKILAMIKSDGYGHGAVRVAQALTQADGFGVAALEEAIKLRRAGVKQPIIIMSQFTHKEQLPLVSEYNLGIVLHDEYQVKFLEEFSPLNSNEESIPVWLKIDTGMHRLGFNADKIGNIWQRLERLSWIKKPLVLMTHLANADLDDDEVTLSQVKNFIKSVSNLPGEFSISNSAGILHYPSIKQNWVRPGIMIYGVSPFLNVEGKNFNLQPVMTLRSYLISVKQAEKGDRVGYGGHFTCPERMPYGIVEIGYGDGYPRHAANGTPVLINNQRCSIIGRVSMDLLTVDLRFCPQAQVGDPVILWGDGLPVEEIAQCANTIPYELLCHMGERVRFVER